MASEKLKSLKVQDGLEGKIAVINGKTYTFLRGYKHHSLGGWFWFAVAGKTRLKKDDLAEYWRVTRAGDVYIAFAARPFSYYLLDDTVKNPKPENKWWPSFRTAATSFAFVGPTEEAAKEQLRLVLDQYRSTLNMDEVLEKSGIKWAIDQAGSQVKALLVPGKNINCNR